jgi:hypothetical protein
VHKRPVAPRAFECGQRAVANGGAGGELLQQQRWREQEHARVPRIAALGQIMLRGFARGLFLERGDRVHARAQLLAALDIAVADFGPVRLDAEGDDAFARERGGALNRGQEGGAVGDDMIGRQQQHQRLGIAFGGERRGDGGDGGGVAGDRFEHDGPGGDADLRQLRRHPGRVRDIAQHQGRGERKRARSPADPRHGLGK